MRLTILAAAAAVTLMAGPASAETKPTVNAPAAPATGADAPGRGDAEIARPADAANAGRPPVPKSPATIDPNRSQPSGPNPSTKP